MRTYPTTVAAWRDRFIEAKLVDVSGLYLDPPERAVVSSFDDKTQCQALDRTQPSLPMKPGRRRTMTHDYKRNGTIDLFAAMNLATGEVLHDTKRRHAGADVSASHWNHDPQPFVWPKTVDDVITKVKRGRATLDRVTESATHH